MSKHTEASMIELLHQRYNTKAGNGAKYVGMAHVRSDAGFDAKRTADFMALDLWPSSGLVLHGHEVKISRSDWLNELKDPEKAGAFLPHVDYWWLVIADRNMVKDGELPKEWGMMAPRADGVLAVVKQAPRLTQPRIKLNEYGRPRSDKEAGAINRGLAVAMLRSAAKSAGATAHREGVAAMDEFRAGHTMQESYTLDKWSPEAAEYHPVETFNDVEALKAAIIACHARGEYRLHGTIHRTYTYTETEWV